MRSFDAIKVSRLLSMALLATTLLFATEDLYSAEVVTTQQTTSAQPKKPARSIRLFHAAGREVEETRQVSEMQDEVREKADSGAYRFSGSMCSDPQENRYRRLAIATASRLVAAFIALTFLATLLPAGTAAAKSIMACCKGQAAGHCHAGFKSKKTASITNPCRSDCCVSSAPAQQQRREQAIAAPAAKLIVPVVVVHHSTNITPVFSAAGEWTKAGPRGPPSFFVEQIS